MKLILANIKEIKKTTDNKLTKRVCNYVISRWNDYEDKKHIFTDVLNYGCQSGVVGELIYYYDTVRFYKQYKEEINNLLCDAMDGTGLYAPSELFGDKWDKEDPLAQYDYNQNLLAWFGFEETLRNIGRKLHLRRKDYENDNNEERKNNRNHEENGYLQAVYKRI